MSKSDFAGQPKSKPKKRWIILKLLDDDYLGSIMTREKYE